MVTGSADLAKPGFLSWTLLWQNTRMAWKLFRSRSQILCAFCSSERRVNRKRSMGFFDIALAMLSSFLLMAIFFRDFDARVFILFVFCLAAGEVFVQMRWRVSLMCPHCGFDPVLYNRSPQAAADKVKLHLEKRRNDPNSLLARPLNIPFRRGSVSAASSPRALAREAKSAENLPDAL